MRGIDGLRRALESLSLRIDDAAVRFEQVTLASYPGGRRPSSTLALSGDGRRGLGEHVGWSEDEHERFAATASRVERGTTALGHWCAALDGLPAYDRAALEAAAIDLALRQNATSLFEICGVSPSPVRFVASFARCDNPVAEAQAAVPPGIELKIDADAAWPAAIWQQLAELGRVAVVDFKLTGTTADSSLALEFLPQAWIEDAGGNGPWSPQLRARLSADAAVTSAAAIEGLQPRPAAVNVKPARIGSVLEAIDCLARCAQLGLVSYVGGMFECGIGRRQLLALAALACPDGPNDIAPLIGADRCGVTVRSLRPARLPVATTAGFAEAN